MHLTPELLETTYEMLCRALPFRSWPMPHPDVVEFRVMRHSDRRAHHRAYADGSRHEIDMSEKLIKTLHELTECMAHEMVHIRQDQLGLRDHHGAGFQALAKLVCKRTGFDLATF